MYTNYATLGTHPKPRLHAMFLARTCMVNRQHVSFFQQDIYVISELMETDLASILKSPQPLSDEHCQFFTYQAEREKLMGVGKNKMQPTNPNAVT